MAVYLLHFDQKVADHAQHYVGYAEDVSARVAEHRAGNGARLTQVCVERGIEFRVVRTWPDGDRALERRIKNTHHRERYCPVCNGKQRR